VQCGESCALLFWQLLAFVGRIEISRILLCLILTLNVANALPLDALQRLMPAVGIPVYETEITKLKNLQTFLEFSFYLSEQFKVS
jgi:hypothetical protein